MGVTGRWEFWVDRGGTFTDCLGREPHSGRIHVAKLLSSDRAPLDGIRTILGLGPAEPVPPCELRMGTTLATNALLQRRGEPCALVITRGFGDLLAIGTQVRPELFALAVNKPPVLYSAVVEVDARAAADGRILCRPNPADLRRDLAALRSSGIDSVAVVVMHAYRAGSLEREIGAVAREIGFGQVSLSHELAAELGMLARGDTAVVDAYLTPLLREYLATLQQELPGSVIRLMQSSGRLADGNGFRGSAAVLSGPAAGVVACAHLSRVAELGELIGFDMGGTSTDVCRVAGEPEHTYETETAGVRIRAPMLAVHTVAAGGGSICRYDGHRFLVGPRSAGAQPGPLCYGRPEARELTLTDVNVALGRLLPDRFPFDLEQQRLQRALADVAERAGWPGEAERAAAGFVRVANERMAEAIKQISVAKGYDVRTHGLCVFGGAAGQHACAIVRLLGMRSAVVHPHAGVLSALGMGLAAIGWQGVEDGARQLLTAPALEALARAALGLARQGRSRMETDAAGQSTAVATQLDLRYQGTETSLTVRWSGTLAVDEAAVAALRRRFETAHQRTFGYRRDGHPIEIMAVRVAVATERALPPAVAPKAAVPAPAARRRSPLWTGERFQSVPVLQREQLGVASPIAGPAIVLEPTGTIVVDEGFTLSVGEDGMVWLADEARALPAAVGPERDPVGLELFVNRFRSIAEQMGNVLRRTALSTNIRERLDFSCALFDRCGGLVVNAPHIPVHLGAMEQTVKALLRDVPLFEPGDAYVTNDPSRGGTHLPDITAISPVHDASGELCALVASRGHHADVGGITPGSMPARACTLAEEGVLLRQLRLVRDDRFDEAALRAALNTGRYPARNPDQNVADLEAQIAANQTGRRLVGELLERSGRATFDAYLRHVQDHAAEVVGRAIERLPDGVRRFSDRLDDGTPVAVQCRVSGAHLTIDFAGTGPQSEGNLNAPRAVVVAAVLYVLRLLVGAPLPLASGCLRPVSLRIPPRSLLDPDRLRAVAGGNVETSQRLVDVLLGALGLAAASQGTMNNVSFGTELYGYYETLGGGVGAGPGFDGASAVHSHMTNTRITDPEVLEAGYPVRLLEFKLRRRSGGAGAYRGGDGLVRQFEALEAMTLSVLTERRVGVPFGLEGGQSGAAGRNSVDGRDIGAKATVELAPGSRVRIATPGGGGFGPPR